MGNKLLFYSCLVTVLLASMGMAHPKPQFDDLEIEYAEYDEECVVEVEADVDSSNLEVVVFVPEESEYEATVNVDEPTKDISLKSDNSCSAIKYVIEMTVAGQCIDYETLAAFPGHIEAFNNQFGFSMHARPEEVFPVLEEQCGISQEDAAILTESNGPTPCEVLTGDFINPADYEYTENYEYGVANTYYLAPPTLYAYPNVGSTGTTSENAKCDVIITVINNVKAEQCIDGMTLLNFASQLGSFNQVDSPDALFSNVEEQCGISKEDTMLLLTEGNVQPCM